MDFLPFTAAALELTRPALARAARLERSSVEGLDDEEEEGEVTENIV